MGSWKTVEKGLKEDRRREKRQEKDKVMKH